MKLAYATDRRGESWWGAVDSNAHTIRRAAVDFDKWVSRVGDQGEVALRLARDAIPLADVHLLPPVSPRARIFGVGMNYQTHLTRLGRKKPPAHTIGYIKPHSAIVGPYDEIQYPAVTAQLDYEIELVAVVARELGNEPQATACLLGYTVGNDISARDAGKQLGVLDVFGQKALDRTAPVGPWVATLDEVGGAGQPELELTLSVNGEVRQRDNTRNMIFALDELLNYVDARIRLRPGDVIFTGSTAGVGLEDGRFLRPGDYVESSIERIGSLRNSIGAQRQLAASRTVGRLGIGTNPSIGAPPSADRDTAPREPT